MMSKPITAILVVALLVSASGTVGPLYFVTSQGQTIEPAEIALSESEASPGSLIELDGADFGSDSLVSIYFMFAEPVDLTEGSAFILQGIDANQSAMIEPGGPSTSLDTSGAAPHTLGDLLQSTINQGGSNTTIATAGVSGHNMLFVLEDDTPVNGTLSLDCEDVTIAQGQINSTIATLAASPGVYNECSISITDDDTTNTGEIDELIISSDSEEDFRTSLVVSATADEEGTFESSITVPNVEGGEYAILAVAEDRRMAISPLSVIAAEPVDESIVNASTANITEGGVIMNETITPAPEEEEDLAEDQSSEPLTAQITSNATEGVAPATFEFEANVTGGAEPYAYSWDFGDDTEGSDEQNPLHTFDEAGTYNVTVVTTDVDNQNTSDSVEINIESAALTPTTVTEPLTAQITSNATEGVAPATFEFEANVTGGAEPYAYSWDFENDGSEDSTEQNPLHTFDEAGDYTVTLAVTDESGQDATNTLDILVTEEPPIVEDLTAQITSNATEGVAPATFEFEANVTGGAEPYAYSWDFGDDTEGSDEQTVMHTFEEPGSYNVSATVTDSSDQTVSDNIEITIEESAPEGVEDETTQPTQNQTQNNQIGNGNGEPTVQLDETSAEPGSPLAISGEGFQPNTPIQIFINNVQITNVIANVEGSFNTVVIVPTTATTGSAQVVVRTEQTHIIQNVNIIGLDGEVEGPSILRLTAVSATDNGEALRNAPVTIFDTNSGEVIERGRTPVDVELEEGVYSIFYSDFGRFEFESAEPGRWINTPDGGSGLITIREGRNTTVTALYSERPAPPSPPRVTDNSLTLRAQDTQGNLIQGMFVTIYDPEDAEEIDQGFTELIVDDLPPGTYPIFFANFEELVFLSGSPGTWIQTPFGGVGLVTIPDDGEDHDIVVTAQYNRTTVVEEQFNIQAPIDVVGNIFTITSNQTRPEGPFVMSGTFALRVSDEDPVSATLSAYFMSAREDSNENVDLESQRSRDHDTFQIVDLKPRVARPIGPDSYVISGTADLLLNGDMYSNDERVHIILRGGEALTPTNIEIDFRGDERYSAANRLDTLYGVISSGFQ